MEESSKSPTKDFWDKLGVLSTFLSSVVIAAVALFVNYSLDVRQQRREEAARVEQQRLTAEQQQLAKVQTLSSFMPHLSGTPENRDTALYAIQALGYSDLATRLAQYTNNQKAGDTIMRTAPASVSVQPKEGTTTPAVDKTEIGWAYLGDYTDNKWNTRYLDFSASEKPRSLQQKVFRVRPETGALNIRLQMPSDMGEFSKIVRVLQPGAAVKVLEVKQWLTTGFTWAQVSLSPN